MQGRSGKDSGRAEANETSEQPPWVLLSRGVDSVGGGDIFAENQTVRQNPVKCFDLGKWSYGKEGVREGFLQLDLEG